MANGTAKQLDLSKSLLTLAIILVAGQVCYWGAQSLGNLWGIWNNYPREISISAQGSFKLIPDVAVINLGVKTEGMKVAGVVKENNEKMNDILAAIKSAGVAEKDIQTLSYNLSQQYDYLDKGERVFRGYLLNQQIGVKIRDFTKIGDVLERSTSLGANSIGDLQFTVDDPAAAKAAALADAIANAKTKAKKIASDSGLKIKKLVNVYEDSSQYANYPTAVGVGGGEMMVKSLSSIAPDIQAGEQEVKATVTLVYRVK
ncbi:MAG: SIMPL domain-containing protein [Candidatus Pacebacteria bacterium]|nr:SIMPL domain-containing protein [Candidatus Paceibacterota bacterium]